MHMLQAPVIFTYAYPAGPVYKCICNWPYITHAHHKAPFKRTRLLAQFSLHTSTHIRRCCEYPYAAVPFSHAHTSLFTHAQTFLFIHAHCTYANPNVALQSVFIAWWTSAGKELISWLSACAVFSLCRLNCLCSVPVWCLGKYVEFDCIGS